MNASMTAAGASGYSLLMMHLPYSALKLVYSFPAMTEGLPLRPCHDRRLRLPHRCPCLPHHGYGSYTRCSDGRTFFYARYIDWVITTPIMLHGLCEFAGAADDVFIYLFF